MVNKNQNEETIKADFNINRLQMDAKLCWLLDLEVKKVLPETFLRYTLELVFNEQPYLDTIKRIEGEIEEVEKEASLFETGKAQRIKVLNRQIKDTREDMADLKDKCPAIDMVVTVQELKYKATGTTFVRMRIPDEKITELNDNKHKFRYYQAVLTPYVEEETTE